MVRIGLSITSLVAMVGEPAVERLFRALRYAFFYKRLVTNLNSEIENVNIEKDSLSRKADEERDNGKVIEARAIQWQDDVEKIQKSVEEFLETYKSRTSWKCWPLLPIPNIVSRFQVGSEAVQMASSLTDFIISGKEILARDIAYFPPYEKLAKSETVLLNFQSREDSFRKLWQALLTEDSSLIIGIYGMPGVGKTRMAEQIWEEASDKNIFDKVTRAYVGSEELNVIKLQQQLASFLGLYFRSEDSVEDRASQLKYSLTSRGKILVILDDVWRDIPLDNIGIPFGNSISSKNIKILFICRDEHVCLRNNTGHTLKIEVLAANDAWDMFSNIVGADALDSLGDVSLAKDVCTRCAGLPLVIVYVGRALQFRPQNIWIYTLHRLENCEIESIGGIHGEVYASFKVSFDNLEEDAAACLFLCSLYPEDTDVPVRTLIQLATGSQLVHGGRSRVRALVDILKSSSLLLQGKDDKHVKLHAILRMVARSIAVEDSKYAFFFATCGSRLPDDVDYGTRQLLHLDLEKNDFHFPDDLVCPDLHTLSLRSVSVTEPNSFAQVPKYNLD